MELTAIDVILNGIRNTLPDEKIDKQEEKILEERDDNKRKS